MARTWRDYFRPLIHKVLEDHEDCDDKTIRKALRENYPNSIRGMHQYRIWLDESKVQRKLKKSKIKYDKNQTSLF